mgnify:CR=1 FL=1
MASGWFIIPYKLRSIKERYCAIDDETPLILESKGQWSGFEIAEDQAIVKVRTSSPVFAILVSKYKFIASYHLDYHLNDAQKVTLLTQLADMGFPTIGLNLTQCTFRDVLSTLATSPLKPRLQGNKIIFDGASLPVGNLDLLDREVS